MRATGGHILAALDGTAAGRTALVQGMTLALSKKASLTAIAVAPRFEGNMDLLSVKDARGRLKLPFENALVEAAELAASRQVPLATLSAEGTPWEQIVEAAENLPADLIILGNQRRNHLERLLVGQTAAHVIGHSPCDALIVPEGSFVDFSRIVAAVDGSVCSMAAARRAVELARTYGGEVLALTALDVPVDRSLIYGVLEDARGKGLAALAAVRRMGGEAGVKVSAEVREGAPYKVLSDYAEEIDAGLLVMGSFGRTALTRLLMGSVVERTLVLSPCPTLVVKRGEAEAAAQGRD